MILSPAPSSFWKSFSRSQVASAAATALDFGVLVILVEWAGLWYVPATALGAFAGAVLNFTLNRSWSFQATEGRWNRQAWRYGLVSGGSLLLNSGGVYGFTEWSGVTYLSSKIVTSLLVGVFFNFPLHRYFVFRLPSRVA